MKSLVYLMLTRAKNQLLQLRRKPGMLVLYLLFIGFLVFSFASAGGEGHRPAGIQLLDIGWLKLAFLGYLALFTVTGIMAGLSTGGSLFDMADANFLFVSPVSAKKILVYGLGQQTVKSIFASVFILFMGSTLKNFWDISAGQLLLLFAGYVLALVLAQILSVVLYMYTCGRPAAKKAVVAVCILLVLPLLASIVLPHLQAGLPMADATLAALDSPALYTLPIIGWLTQAVFALLAGNLAAAVLPLLLCAGLVVLAIALILAGKTDYYEDILVATETAYQRKQAAQEGNLQAMESQSKARVGKETGKQIWGWGASAFLGRHMRESFRKNPLKLLDKSSLSYILTAVLMAFILRGDSNMVSILITVMAMRTFLVGTGLGMRELYSHYIFMVPASSFSKIVWSNIEVSVKSLAESIVCYGIAAIFIKTPFPVVLMCIVTTSVFTIMLVSVNLLSMRMFSSIISQGLLLSFYMLFILLVMAPGVVAAILCAVLLGSLGSLASTLLALAALTLWQLLLSALFFFLSRGVLDTCDMETLPQGTK